MQKWWLGVFGVVAVGYAWTQFKEKQPTLETPIFQFEKQELEEVVIHQPDQEIHLVEQDGTWVLLEADNQASTTMVNRSKHQLHDLTARSIVETNPQAPEQYGLGDDAIQVDLQLRSGETLSLKVGDPNPTGVSYYMMPLSGPHQGSVVTVAKASVDFFASKLSDFRAEHFVQFDLGTVTHISVEMHPSIAGEIEGVQPFSESKVWTVNRSTHGELTRWTGGFSGDKQVISKDFIRRLLGRLIALKAVEYKGVLEISDETAGLETPFAKLRVRGSNVDVGLVVGASVAEGQRVVQVVGDTERVVTRDGFLEELMFEESKVRNPFMLDAVLDVDGLQELDVELSSKKYRVQQIQKAWRFNENSVSSEELAATLSYIAEFRALSWEDETMQQPIVPTGEKIQVAHDLGYVTFLVGQIVEKDIALPDEEPQIVQYRRLNVLSGMQDPNPVLIEEHWWQTTQEKLQLFEESLQNPNNGAP